MHFLVVDDDPHILEALTVSLQLQWPENTIHPAADGAAGLSAFYAYQPDLIVLDLSLPEKNGFEVLQEIRRTSAVPVIILTARGDDLSQVLGLELVPDGELRKPINPVDLIPRIVERPLEAVEDNGGLADTQLGVDSLLGGPTTVLEQVLVARLGPMDAQVANTFAPGQVGRRKLEHLLGLLTRADQFAQVEIAVKPAPAGARLATERGYCRLGVTSILD